MKKGFTLIELLAVIVILAVIALIVTPVINNIIESAKEKSFLNSSYGILQTAEYYYSNPLEKSKVNEIDLKTDILKYNGPHYEGLLMHNSSNKIAFYIKDNNLCVVKDYDEQMPVLVKDSNCGTNSIYGQENIIEEGKTKIDNSVATDLENIVITGKTRQETKEEFNYITYDDLSNYRSCCNETRTTVKTVDDSSAITGHRLDITYYASSKNGGYFIRNVETKNGHTYTWSLYIKTTYPSEYRIGLENNGYKSVEIDTNWQKVTYTSAVSNSFYRAFIIYAQSNIPAGTVVSIKDLQVVEGESLPTNYPFNGDVIPSPLAPGKITSLGDSKKIDVVVTGKNIFKTFNSDETALSPEWKQIGWNGTMQKNEDSSIQIRAINGWHKIYQKLPDVYANKKVRISFKVKSPSDIYSEHLFSIGASITDYYNISQDLMNKPQITNEYQQVSGTIQLGSDCCLGIIVMINEENKEYEARVDIKDIMVEIVENESMEEVTYEPYKEMISEINLSEPLSCINSTCDYIDFKNKKIVRKIKPFEINSTNVNDFSYTYNSISNNGLYLEYTINHSSASLYDNTDSSRILSKQFRYYDKANQPDKNNEGIIASPNDKLLTLSLKATKLSEASVNAFKTWINNNPLLFYKTLKKPFEENISLPEIKTYKGTNNIYVKESNSTFSNTITASYRTKR